VEHFTHFADTVLEKHDIKLSFTEGRGHLVFGHADTSPAADGIATLLDTLCFTNIEAHAGVEFQGAATWLRFWAAIHHTDLLTDLVGEHDRHVRLFDCAGELAQRLTHQAGLQTDVTITHFAF